MNRRNDYSEENLFHCSYGHLTVVLTHTGNTVNSSFNPPVVLGSRKEEEGRMQREAKKNGGQKEGRKERREEGRTEERKERRERKVDGGKKEGRRGREK